MDEDDFNSLELEILAPAKERVVSEGEIELKLMELEMEKQKAKV